MGASLHGFVTHECQNHGENFTSGKLYIMKFLKLVFFIGSAIVMVPGYFIQSITVVDIITSPSSSPSPSLPCHFSGCHGR